MANWQMRVVLPTLVQAARDSPSRQLEVIIAEMVTTARARGMDSMVDALELVPRELGPRKFQGVIAPRNDEGPPEEGPSRAATTAAEE